jgi:hypothetical protein
VVPLEIADIRGAKDVKIPPVGLAAHRLETILELWRILCCVLYSYEDMIIRESRSGGSLRAVLANIFLKN